MTTEVHMMQVTICGLPFACSVYQNLMNTERASVPHGTRAVRVEVQQRLRHGRSELIFIAFFSFVGFFCACGPLSSIPSFLFFFNGGSVAAGGFGVE